MKRILTKEEALMEKEGFGRFNLRRSCDATKLPRTRTGPKFKITNRPSRELVMPTLPRTKMVPKLVKDSFGNDVRTFVPYKKRKRG